MEKRMKRTVKVFPAMLVLVLICTTMYSQPSPIKISWGATLNCERCQLDSVVVTNKSNGAKKVYRYPDTVLVYGGGVGITPVTPDVETSLKIYPNPFSDKVQVEFSLAQPSETEFTVFDLQGREITRKNCVLEKGTQRFELSLPSGIYALQVRTATGVQSARLLSEGNKGVAPQIVHAGRVADAVPVPKKTQKSGDADLPFEYGDTLVMQGFISDSGVFQYKEEHVVPLTRDTDVVFEFFNYIGFKNTSGIIIIDSIRRSDIIMIDSEYYRVPMPCYYASVPPSYASDGIFSNPFMFVNTQSDLDTLFACDSMARPVVDFSQQTLVLLKVGTPSQGHNLPVSFNFIKNCNEDYVFEIYLLDGRLPACDHFYCMVILNEVIQSKEQLIVRISLRDWR